MYQCGCVRACACVCGVCEVGEKARGHSGSLTNLCPCPHTSLPALCPPPTFSNIPRKGYCSQILSVHNLILVSPLTPNTQCVQCVPGASLKRCTDNFQAVNPNRGLAFHFVVARGILEGGAWPGLASPPGRVWGGAFGGGARPLFFPPLLAVRSAEAWGSRAAARRWRWGRAERRQRSSVARRSDKADNSADSPARESLSWDLIFKALFSLNI